MNTLALDVDNWAHIIQFPISLVEISAWPGHLSPRLAIDSHLLLAAPASSLASHVC